MQVTVELPDHGARQWGETPDAAGRHVMEEAEQCHHLLLLRDGQLLASDSPGALRRKTRTKTIGDAFLSLVEGAGA